MSVRIPDSCIVAKTAVIYENVVLGENCRIEDFCIIGAPLRDGSQPSTFVGKGAWIRSHTVIYAGNMIGKNFQSGNKANIRELNQIGDNVSIGTLSVIEHHVRIESDVRIHTSAFIPEFSILKRGSWIGPHAVFTNAKLPNSEDAKKNLKGPTLDENSIVGANATLSPGISIGRNSLVGSGSNVTRSIPENTIVVGNPALRKKDR